MRSLKAPFVPGMVAAGCLIAVGMTAALSTLAIQISTRQQIGPATAPLAISLVLVLVGLALAGQAFAGRWSCDANEPTGSRPRIAPAGWLVAGIVSCLLLIEPVGFSPAAGLLFACVARALGGRSLLGSLIVGLVLAGTLELLFTRFLGVDLGSGILSLAGW